MLTKCFTRNLSVALLNYICATSELSLKHLIDTEGGGGCKQRLQIRTLLSIIHKGISEIMLVLDYLDFRLQTHRQTELYN